MEEGHVESWISFITLGVGDLALAPLLPGPPRLALLRPQHLTQPALLCRSDDRVGERRVLDTEPSQVGHGDLVVVRTTSRLQRQWVLTRRHLPDAGSQQRSRGEPPPASLPAAGGR